MRPSGWSMQTILGLLIGSVGLLLVAVSVEALIDAGLRYGSSRRIAELSVISKPLLTSLIGARVERGTIANALLGDDPIDADSLQVIRQARRDADETYAQAMRGLARTSLATVSDSANTLRRTHDAAAALRERADAAVQLPKPQRDPDLVRNEPPVFQLWVDATLAASELVEPAMMLIEPKIDQLLSVKRAAWAIRSSAGLIMNRSEGAALSGRPWTPADALAAAANRGQVQQAWSVIRAAAARPDAPEEIVRAVARAEREFSAYFEGELKGYLDTLSAGKMIDIGFAELQRRNTVAARAIAALAQTALSVMVDLADAEMRWASIDLMLHAATLFCAVAFVAGCLMTLRQRICRPLLAMTSTMRRLAERETTVEIPGRGRGDEIGAMAMAMQVFKDSIIEALAAGHVREQADRELRTQNVRFAAALGSMSQGLGMFDASDRLVVRNQQFAAILGIPAAGIAAGTTIDDMRHSLDQASGLLAADIAEIHETIVRLGTGGTRASHVQELADGRRLLVNFAPMEDDGWLMTLEDITAQRLVEARIAHMAHHDALTGLANRVLFHERLTEAVARSRRGERFAVLYLDLDHFKAVNDTLGHPVGDALLREVTQRLKRQVREIDTTARLGGDEFAIVQSISQPSDSSALAKRVIEAVSAPYAFNGNRVIIGTSIGIAMVPDNGEDVDEIIKNADMALYRSKAAGRGRYQFFETEMNARMQARRTLDLDLRKALQEGEFRLFYQPLIDVATRSVCGFEALLRWQHPDRGMVSPADFIPLAEETGLIVPLGEWVLRRACADAATWPDDLKVAVNLSPVQFGSHTLVEAVAAALADARLDVSRLELEITETAMLADTTAVLVILHQLRDLGLKIALDDFGTGYSSLSYLQRFPFSKVKIDRSFVARLGLGGDNDTIVAAVIDLCGRLRMDTTGEGVETVAQLDRLASLHCTEAQGYLFSRPRPASEVTAMVMEMNRRERGEITTVPALYA
jgi:diguanylate cyclase (GGDEF)-like protein